jgi:uncharacterized protein YbcC (UPF0753/DUF2309 family)
MHPDSLEFRTCKTLAYTSLCPDVTVEISARLTALMCLVRSIQGESYSAIVNRLRKNSINSVNTHSNGKSMSENKLALRVMFTSSEGLRWLQSFHPSIANDCVVRFADYGIYATKNIEYSDSITVQSTLSG